jgi:hypothetical protein
LHCAATGADDPRHLANKGCEPRAVALAWSAGNDALHSVPHERQRP